jgi:hypothetical protein
MKKNVITIIIVLVIYAISWFLIPVQRSKALIWGIILIPILFIVSVNEEKKSDKFNKNKIINRNIESILKDFINETAIGRQDQIIRLINNPIIWCGIIDEIDEKIL